ncbi:MAG: ABC transporter permease [Planctomycetota bacterium]
MAGYLRALSAEVLKYRRTTAVWLAFGIPVLIIVLAGIVLTQSDVAEASVERKWNALQGITAQTWVTMCLPIGGAILIGMLWGIEHGSNQLKHILAQPPSRAAQFWAKTTGIFALIALGTAFLGVLCAGLATVLGMGPVRWEVAFELPFRALAGAVPTLGLISWLAQRYSSFALPVILGVVGVVVGGIAGSSPDHWLYVPWSWSMIASIAGDGDDRQLALLLGLGVGALVLLGSMVDFVRSDSPR